MQSYLKTSFRIGKYSGKGVVVQTLLSVRNLREDEVEDRWREYFLHLLNGNKLEMLIIVE